jgi:hypothetical protein
MRNVLAVAWSNDDLLAMMTRAAWRGPKNQVHVLDASRDFATLAKLDLEGDPERPNGCLSFSGEHLIGYVGRHASAWSPRSGELEFHAEVEGWMFALYPDGRAGVNANGTLRLQTLASGSKRKLGFSAARLTPIAGTDGDWAIVEDGEIRRVSSPGEVRWKAPMDGQIQHMAASADSVVVAMNAEKAVHVHAAATGEVTARIPLEDQIGSVGLLPDGTVWILEWHGRLALHAPRGTLLRETTIDALVMDAEMSPDGTQLAIRHDLLELRSCLRVVDTTTGALLFESSARANKAPAARGGGEGVFAKDGKLWKRGTKPTEAKSFGTYAGEVKVAMAKDGSLALVLDDDGVRVFDVKTAKQTISLTHAKIEEETIDVVDEPLFDKDGRPCVKVGKHTFVVTEDGVVSAKAAKTAKKKRGRSEKKH